MKRFVLVVGMLAGFMAGACGVEESAPGEFTTAGEVSTPGEDNAIRDDDPHLPGSCTNPVACGTTNGVDPTGDGGGTPPAGCTGCDCKTGTARSNCRTCQTRCAADGLRCIGSFGPGSGGGSDEACRETERDCTRHCAD